MQNYMVYTISVHGEGIRCVHYTVAACRPALCWCRMDVQPWCWLRRLDIMTSLRYCYIITPTLHNETWSFPPFTV